MSTWLLLALACLPDDGPRPVRARTMEAVPSEAFVGPVTVSWNQREPASARVEYALDGEWRSTPEREVTAGDVAMTVVGLPPDTVAPWRVVLETAEGVLVQDAPDPIETPALPGGFPPLELEVPDALGRDDYLLTSVNESGCGWCSGPYWTFLVDRAGRVVWATKTSFAEWTLFSQLSTTGDHVLYDVVRNDGASYAVRTWLDRRIETIAMPGHHHGFVELPDGTLAWGRWDAPSTVETIAERAPGSDEIRTVWGCTDWRQVEKCRSNALEYDPKRDVYWFSFYTQSSVAEIDRTTGTLLGYSDLRDVALDELEYTFDPPESTFRWQHAPRVLDNGNLLVSTDDQARTTTRVAEYAIDREEGRLTEVWSYDPGIKSNYNGDVLRTPGGTTLHALGAAGVIYEVTDQGEVVWRVAFPRGHQVGRMAIVDDLYSLVAPPEDAWP